MTNINTVIFDLGGVLIDWNPSYVFSDVFSDSAEMNYFLDRICTPEWNEEQDAGRSLALATEEKVLEYPEYEESIRSFYGRWEEMIGGAILPTVEILNDLVKEGKYRLFALSNWSAETFPYALANFPFLEWFEGIVISGNEGMRKPQKEFYELLIDRYDIRKEGALFIDDNQRNIDAAREMGICSIHYSDSHSLRKSLTNLEVLEQGAM